MKRLLLMTFLCTAAPLGAQVLVKPAPVKPAPVTVAPIPGHQQVPSPVPTKQGSSVKAPQGAGPVNPQGRSTGIRPTGLPPGAKTSVPVAAPIIGRKPSTEAQVPSAGVQTPGTVTSTFRALVDSLSAPPSYVREIFQYPIAGRTDPVTPPLSLLSADAYPAISLSGIVYDEHNPSHSYAMVRFPGAAGASEGGSRQVIHIGDVIGQYVISTIERTRVGVDVRLFGGVRRVYMTQGTSPDSPRKTSRPGRVR